jgi:hypothetical protein
LRAERVFSGRAAARIRFEVMTEEVLEDLSFEEFPRTPVVSFASLVEDGSYVKCNARVPNPNGGEHKTQPCNRIGVLSWKAKVGCCVVEHANGEIHTIGYDDAVQLKPAPIDEQNHAVIKRLSKAGRGEVQ